MKQIQIIIIKQTVSEGFYIMMRGHMPNEAFKSFLSIRLPTYKDAYNQALVIGHAVQLLGNEVKLLNDKSAEIDAKEFCDYMAFVQFETFKE